jgi:hypothetical protein
MPVEHHRDIPDEQPPERGDRNRRIVDRDEAIGNGALIELCELVCEVLRELDGESRFDLAPDYAKVAHQVGDDESADVIICVEPVAALDGEASGVDRRVVLGQLLRVLRKRAAHVADSRNAGGQHVGRRASRVAHEVAVQPAGGRGDRKLVGRQSEMVHADLLVAGGAEPLHGLDEQLDLALGRRQVVGAQIFLMAANPRHVRVGVDGDPIGPHRHHGVGGLAERGPRLQRQAVDQIDVDRLESEIAGGVEQCTGERL